MEKVNCSTWSSISVNNLILLVPYNKTGMQVLSSYNKIAAVHVVDY